MYSIKGKEQGTRKKLKLCKRNRTDVFQSDSGAGIGQSVGHNSRERLPCSSWGLGRVRGEDRKRVGAVGCRNDFYVSRSASRSGGWG